MTTREDSSMSSSVPDHAGTTGLPSGEIRRVGLASFIGTTIEWYDYFVFATASALVFNQQFFPNIDPTTGTILAFATFGIGFLALPLGGIVAGHFGDRLGRKAVLIATLVLMGGATTAIGLLPGYATIGIAAPILLVVLRLLQGFAAGGEWGGAALMAVEHAPAGRRGLWGSIAQVGVPFGLILANCVILVVEAAMTKEQFLSWGWRIPFLVSILLVLVGLLIRVRVSESPIFETMRRSHRQATRPLVELFRHNRTDVAIATVTFIANSAIPYVFLVFMLSYGTSVLNMSPSTMLFVIIVGALGWLPAIVLAGHLSDRIGRRRVYLIGYAVLAVWAFPFFALTNTTNVGLMIVATLVLTVGSGLAFGPQPALFAEMFGPDVRYSGVSTSYALGGLLGGAFAPLIAAALFAATGSAYYVSAYMAALAVLSFGATLLIREPKLREMREADERRLAEAATLY